MDPGMNQLLQWGIENSDAARPDGAEAADPSNPQRNLNTDALRALMGGPSDADLMRESMTVIVHPEATFESKITAFDNFEQLVENIDNANNIASLGLWEPLVSQLSSTEPEMRKMAAWCIGTAVQNNVKAQDRLLAVNGIPKLCKLAVEDTDPHVRRKATYALSSEVRNYQPGMNEVVKNLPKEITGPDQVSASDMDAIDAIMAKLRERE